MKYTNTMDRAVCWRGIVVMPGETVEDNKKEEKVEDEKKDEKPKRKYKKKKVVEDNLTEE